MKIPWKCHNLGMPCKDPRAIKVWLITPTIAHISLQIRSRKAGSLNRLLKTPGLEKEIIQVIKFLTILPFFHCQLFHQRLRAWEIIPAVSAIWPWDSFLTSISFSSAPLASKGGNLTHLSDFTPRPSEPPWTSLSLYAMCCIPWQDTCWCTYICSLGTTSSSLHLPPSKLHLSLCPSNM